MEIRALATFLVIAFVLLTLGIAWYSRRWTRTTVEFYVAGSKITWLANGLALVGDYLSAASFLGVAGGIAIFGIDRFWDALGYFSGYLVVLLLIAGPLRNVGKYTVADVLDFRYSSNTLRVVIMVATLFISTFYLIPQMLGAGVLFQTLLGLPYVLTTVLVGGVIVLYVVLGGMRGTTYNQILMGVLLWFVMLFILILVSAFYFHGSPGVILDAAKKMVPPGVVSENAEVTSDITGIPDFSNQEDALEKVGNIKISKEGSDKAVETAARELPDSGKSLAPGSFSKDLPNALAFAIGIIFGTAGLPHILIRFYTVPDAKAAKRSVVTCLVGVGTFYIFASFVGLAAMYLLYPKLVGWLASGPAGAGLAKNMPVPLLGELVGGEFMLGIAAAGAMSAMLSTCVGLLIAGSTSVAYDLYKNILHPEATERSQIAVAKITALVMGIIAIFLAIVLKGANVSFLVTLAFGIAASCLFPVLFLSLWWKKLTRQGAIWGIATGLVVSAVFVTGQLMGAKAILGLPVLVNPGLYGIPATFIVAMLISFGTQDVGEVEKFMSIAHSEEA